MNITKSKSFTTSDNQIFATIEAAQQHELEAYLVKTGVNSCAALSNNSKEIAAALIENADAVVNLLTLKSTSRPSARKVNKKGGKKPAPAAAVIEVVA